MVLGLSDLRGTRRRAIVAGAGDVMHRHHAERQNAEREQPKQRP